MVLERLEDGNDRMAAAAVRIDDAPDDVEVGRGHLVPMQYRCFLPRM